jgi:protein-S-isoprenylcysteine O-methyltransferase Ste14
VSAETDHAGVVVRPPLLYGGVILFVLFLRWFWPLPMFSHPTNLWIGGVLLVLGVAIVATGRRAMKSGGTNVDPYKPSTAIVQSGLFRFTRNPLYLGLTLLYLGLTIMFNTWWGFVLLVPVVLIMHWGVVRREEVYLERKFGDSYRGYRSRVRRYF